MLRMSIIPVTNVDRRGVLLPNAMVAEVPPNKVFGMTDEYFAENGRLTNGGQTGILTSDLQVTRKAMRNFVQHHEW